MKFKVERKFLMEKIVGIAGQHLTRQENHLLDLDIDKTPKALTDALKQANLLPLIIPMSTPETAKKYISQVDALILAGGADIDPLLYNEEPLAKIGIIEPERDYFEMALIQEALNQKKAILGICRGLQILNVTLGGSLYQDLSYYADLKINHRQKTPWEFPTHSIRTAQGSILEKALSEKNVVNSYHHQAVKVLADYFQPIAWSPDGIVEAFESKNNDPYILAMQWHPELLTETRPENQIIFKEFAARM